MGVGDYTLLWAYVTQADKVFNIKQLTDLRNIIERNFTPFQSVINQNNLVIFERTSPIELQTRLTRTRQYIQNLFSSMRIGLPNFERLESLPQNSFRAVITALGTFVATAQGTTVQFYNNLIELKKKLNSFGIEVDFGALVRTRKGNGSNVVNNNQKDVLIELEDVVMSDNFVQLIEGGAAVGYVFNEENGGMVEFSFNDLKMMSNKDSIKFDVLNTFLAQFGLEMSPEYYQAYIQVNGETNNMFERMDAQYQKYNSDRGQLDMETSTFDDYYGAPYSTVPAYESYINEKQAEDDLNEKTCK